MLKQINPISSPRHKAKFPWKPLHGVLNRDHSNCKCIRVFQGLLIINHKNIKMMTFINSSHDLLPDFYGDMTFISVPAGICIFCEKSYESSHPTLPKNSLILINIKFLNSRQELCYQWQKGMSIISLIIKTSKFKQQ